MQHVDRRELFTSLSTLVNYLKEFMEFSRDDAAPLADGQPYFKVIMPAIVNIVYKKLLQHDITARVFRNRDSRSEVDPDVWPEEASQAIQTRKIFLRWYLTRLTSGPSNMDYWEYLDTVGCAKMLLKGFPHIWTVCAGSCTLGKVAATHCTWTASFWAPP
jgi:hypothetical protein